MQIEMLLNFLVNPKLVITEIRPKHIWLVSVAVALASIASLTMGNFVAFRSTGGLAQWIIGTCITAVSLIAWMYFYVPLIHALAERFMPQSRVSDLLIYSGFSFAPLLLALPVSMLCAVFTGGMIFYVIFVLVAFTRVLSSLISGVKVNYNISSGRATWLTLLPSVIMCLIPFALMILSVMLFSYD